MKNSIFSILQRIGRSFMLPIAILPIAGLFLGIGSSFTNETTIATYSLEKLLGNGTILNSLLLIMKFAGNIIFSNLPILFAIGVAVGMAKKEKEVAGIASIISFLIMHATINALLKITGILDNDVLNEGVLASEVGIITLQMGVFGGAIVGLGVAFLHNKFYKIELPNVLSFFGGSKFIPIISGITYMIVGIILFFIWPIIQNGITCLGNIVNSTGYFGTFLYGFIERALIPFGLHHVFYIPFWQTALGGKEIIDGVTVAGAQNIFFAELASKNTIHFNVDATKFMAGKFPFMMIGLPGAALALYSTSAAKNKKLISGLIVSATLTSILTGITEPLEFSFLFAAPPLYVIHCIFTGLSFMFCHILNVGVGQTFSGSFIDFLLFGVMQGNEKTNWINIIIIGIPLFILYYFIFKKLILKFDYKTPGRDDIDEVKLYTKKDYENLKKCNKNKLYNDEEKNNYEVSELIIEGIGGKKNIEDLDSCITRLRITVKDENIINKSILEKSGAKGVIQKGKGIQIVYGTKVSIIKSNLEEYIDSID